MSEQLRTKIHNDRTNWRGVTAALSGSCFAQDIMQGDSFVCIYTHIAKKRKNMFVIKAIKANWRWWASFISWESHALRLVKLFMIKKDTWQQVFWVFFPYPKHMEMQMFLRF